MTERWMVGDAGRDKNLINLSYFYDFMAHRLTVATRARVHPVGDVSWEVTFFLWLLDDKDVDGNSRWVISNKRFMAVSFGGAEGRF